MEDILINVIGKFFAFLIVCMLFFIWKWIRKRIDK